MCYTTLLKNQLSHLEKELEEFPDDWNDYNPDEYLNKGRSIIILQAELERGLGIYKKISWYEEESGYNPLEDEIVQYFERLKLRITENNILKMIKEKYDPYFVTQKLAKKILEQKTKESQSKQTKKEDKFDPMYS